jgi:hypothetical protein
LLAWTPRLRYICVRLSGTAFERAKSEASDLRPEWFNGKAGV